MIYKSHLQNYLIHMSKITQKEKLNSISYMAMMINKKLITDEKEAFGNNMNLFSFRTFGCTDQDVTHSLDQQPTMSSLKGDTSTTLPLLECPQDRKQPKRRDASTNLFHLIHSDSS